MKRLALLLPLVALAACADNAASIEVQGICVPKAGCTFSGKCDSFIVANPTLDSSATNWMMLFFQVANQLPKNAVSESGKLNTNDATVDEAKIEFSGALGGSVVMGLNGPVPANGTSVIGVEVIPGSVGAALTATPPAWPNYLEALAKVRLRGSLQDGTRFETAEYPVTIDLTTGAPQTAICAGACPQLNQYPAGCP